MGQDHYATIATIDGLKMPEVRHKWSPLIYTNLLGVSKIVQAVRTFTSISDALKMLRYALKHQTRAFEELEFSEDIREHFPYLYFRGQASIAWPMIPTLYRDLPERPGEREPALVDRIAKTIEFIQRLETDNELQTKLPWLGGLMLEQKRALARHYGMPSPYLDFTTDPHVAAFFASRVNVGFYTKETFVGNIFMLNLAYLFKIFKYRIKDFEDGTVLELSAPGEVLKIPYLTITHDNHVAPDTLYIRVHKKAGPLYTLRWTRVPDAPRIRAQRAVFLRAGSAEEGLLGRSSLNWVGAPDLYNLVDFLSFKFAFDQRRPYWSLFRGVRARKLMPSRDPLAELPGAS